MSLKQLSTAEMVSVSGGWVEPGPVAKALAARPETAGLMERVGAAHRALVAAQPREADPRLGAIVAEAMEVDRRHDALARGIDALLMGLGLLATSASEAESLGRLRLLLFPDGLSLVQQSYRAEAGAATLLAERLEQNPEAQALLASTQVGPTSLRTHVNALIDAARHLGTLEDKRATLRALAPSDAKVHLDARNGWIRVVNALLANARLADFDEATELAIFGPLRRAEAGAMRRTTPGSAPVTAEEDTAAPTDPA